ncbi:MAG: ATP-binding cassette domain-containing protein [Bacteroidales bacterium]
MKESVLKALVQLFAIISTLQEQNISAGIRNIVESYLRIYVSRDQLEEFLSLYDNYIASSKRAETDADSVHGRKKRSSENVKVLRICEKINESLVLEEKILVFVRLIELVNEDHRITHNEEDFLSTVADTFLFEPFETKQLKSFVLNNGKGIPDECLLTIDKSPDAEDRLQRHIYRPNLEGMIIVTLVSSSQTFLFKYLGKKNLQLNAHDILPGRTYILDAGSVIRSPKIRPVYHGEVARRFFASSAGTRIFFTAENLGFSFPRSDNGIKPFLFTARSGHLIGIMGGSGTGKSTLLNLLNGNLQPDEGRVMINGINLHREKEKLEGVIGYVPQDDLLIEELTVFENLYYNARLCFADYSHYKILRTVMQVLHDLDLEPIKHLKVGDPLNKTISGGQRKRLNIALELIRQPSILFVDEPTSGLSSMDSEMVMLLLKQLTLKGKLVIVNIHQPSSFIYKLFDKLLVLDRGGYPIYQGAPLDAVVYFKKLSAQVNADESHCPTCGNVNPEQVLQIVENRVVNQRGKLTQMRRVSPEDWYKLYKTHIEANKKPQHKKAPLPENPFRIPDRWKQFKIFSLRNLLTKWANGQYMAVNFLEAPLLALILGYFTKYITGTETDPNAYVFYGNENLPAFLLMCVIVALFIGMTVSAEEIIRDARLLKREKFLNLSRFSYLSSKVVVLLLISAVQMLTYVLVGHLILEIRAMALQHWLILFSTAVVANLIGLNISAAFRTVVTIYILIPLVLVPLILFSGAIIPFDKLHKQISSLKVVPVVGDLMASRWSYEALAVTQFRDNPFQKQFFDLDMEISEAVWVNSFLLPRLEQMVDQALRNEQPADWMLEVLNNEIKKLNDDPRHPPFQGSLPLSVENLNSEALSMHFTEIRGIYSDIQRKANREKERLYEKMISEKGGTEEFLHYRNRYANHALTDLVTQRNRVEKIQIYRNTLLRRYEPIYQIPDSRLGRAHFYAAYKRIGPWIIDTFWFNLTALWLFVLVLSITLYFNVLGRIVAYFESLNRQYQFIRAQLHIEKNGYKTLVRKIRKLAGTRKFFH